MKVALRVFLPVLLLGATAACDSTTDPEVPTPGVELRVDFEGASLESWSQPHPGTFTLRVGKDTSSDFARWYSFRVSGGSEETLTFRIANAGDLSAAAAFSFNRPSVSGDGGSTWGRIHEAEYDAGVFSFTHTPSSEETWVALGPVYNFSRWLSLVEEIKDHAAVDSIEVIAETLQGRPLHLVRITDPSVPDSVKGAVWGIARQHPGEVGGSWMAEGLLRWLLSEAPQARELRRRAVFHLVPFMNPDGVVLGNYRVNSVGANLNREWARRDRSTAPTVAAVAARIQEHATSGRPLDFFVDLHAYSSLRKNFFFFSGPDRAPAEDVREIQELMTCFQAMNGDFSQGGSEPSADDDRLARGWVFENFAAQAITFECSYQDVTYGPYAGEYMTTDRYRALGEGLGRAIAEILYGVEGGRRLMRGPAHATGR